MGFGRRGWSVFSLAYVFLHRGLTEFFGRAAYQWRLQVLLAAVTLAVQVEFGLVEPNTGHRLFWYSLVLAAQLGLSAVVVFRTAAGPLRASGWMMGGVLALLCANNILRSAGILFSGAPNNYLEGGAVLSSTLLATSVLQGAVMIALVWMTAAGLRRELEVQASTDPLTGLLNRRAIEELAEREILLSGFQRHSISAILIDLDCFKQINDSFGHSFGDTVLIGVAECLKGKMRSQDHLARIGGDEFVVLLSNTAWEEASNVAEGLRSCLEETHLAEGEVRAMVRASFGGAELGANLGIIEGIIEGIVEGIAEGRGKQRGWDELMMSCDRALYAVKKLGGNNVLVH